MCVLNYHYKIHNPSQYLQNFMMQNDYFEIS